MIDSGEFYSGVRAGWAGLNKNSAEKLIMSWKATLVHLGNNLPVSSKLLPTRNLLI